MKRITIKVPQPNPKQIRFLRDTRKYLAFGGARGGGKSWAVREQALEMALRYAGIRILIVRRTFPELRDNHIVPLCAVIKPEFARYNDSYKEITFRNGSTIKFGYCESEPDMQQYQGRQWDVIYIDEATQLDEIVFQMFKGCVRGVNQFPKWIRLTCNPGGRGHAWVKRLFVDRLYNDREKPEDYGFVQSLMTDNIALMRVQPDYADQFAGLPPKLREAWVLGRWDLFEGQFFEEFVNEPCDKEGKPTKQWTHVIQAFDPPRSWKRYRSYDWGYNKPFSCGWWAVDPHGCYYRILELYGCTETPNEGVKWTDDVQFDKIAQVEREHPWLKGCEIQGVADPSIWNKSKTGVSTADMAARQGIYFRKGDNARIPGWMQVHYRLRFDKDGYPMMYVFEKCKAFIRTMPMLCYDPHMPEDLDSKMEDHVADEVRYFCMMNPLAEPIREAMPEPEYDPLDRKPLVNRRDENYYYRL